MRASAKGHRRPGPPADASSVGAEGSAAPATAASAPAPAAEPPLGEWRSASWILEHIFYGCVADAANYMRHVAQNAPARWRHGEERGTIPMWFVLEGDSAWPLTAPRALEGTLPVRAPTQPPEADVAQPDASLLQATLETRRRRAREAWRLRLEETWAPAGSWRTSGWARSLARGDPSEIPWPGGFAPSGALGSQVSGRLRN